VNSWPIGDGPELNKKIALEPKRFDQYVSAIEDSGGELTQLAADVTALVWTDYARPDLLRMTLAENPQLEWVQLPFAGVDAFSEIIANNPQIVFTSAKRSYSEPVAEHALMLSLALGRILPERIRAKSWGKKHADSLFDENFLIIGGGGIAQQLVDLLEPFRTQVIVVRKRTNEPFMNSQYSRVVGFDALDSEISKAKFVVIACALTEETKHLFDKQMLSRMRPDSYLVNVARGEVVNQDDLIEALQQKTITAAATDVTYPEPLPEGHPMWQVENLIITPHTADTMPIVTRLFAQRLRENVRAFVEGDSFVGIVSRELGY
jgi:phosphoglycerate dehydrogenase-like enzyme